jgi:hypothetical protein
VHGGAQVEDDEGIDDEGGALEIREDIVNAEE